MNFYQFDQFLIFDIYQYSLSYAYSTSKPKWYLIGRYVYGLKNRLYFREDISNEAEVENEFFIGYTSHYIIGSIFGITYVCLNIFQFSFAGEM